MTDDDDLISKEISEERDRCIRAYVQLTDDKSEKIEQIVRVMKNGDKRGKTESSMSGKSQTNKSH